MINQGAAAVPAGGTPDQPKPLRTMRRDARVEVFRLMSAKHQTIERSFPRKDHRAPAVAG